MHGNKLGRLFRLMVAGVVALMRLHQTGTSITSDHSAFLSIYLPVRLFVSPAVSVRRMNYAQNTKKVAFTIIYNPKNSFTCMPVCSLSVSLFGPLFGRAIRGSCGSVRISRLE